MSQIHVVWLFFLYSCCWQVSSKGLLLPFLGWLQDEASWGCKQKAKRLAVTARFEIHQSLFFSFLWTLAVLMKGWYFHIHAGLPSSGHSVTREAAPVPVQVWGAQQVLAQSLSLKCCPWLGHSSSPAQSLCSAPARSECVTVAGVLQTGSCDCSQERPQCHRTDRSDF